MNIHKSWGLINFFSASVTHVKNIGKISTNVKHWLCCKYRASSWIFFFFFSDREYDCNKHCGVVVEETGKACTRSLTCKVCNLLINLRWHHWLNRDFQNIADHWFLEIDGRNLWSAESARLFRSPAVKLHQAKQYLNLRMIKKSILCQTHNILEAQIMCVLLNTS